MIELTTQNFQEEVKKGTVLVDFYAVWCGPCKMMHPIIEELAKEHPELKVIKVNVDEQEELARQYGIMSIPSLLLFQEGNLKDQKIGFTVKEDLENWIKKV